MYGSILWNLNTKELGMLENWPQISLGLFSSASPCSRNKKFGGDTLGEVFRVFPKPPVQLKPQGCGPSYVGQL